jgi:drug/metabolite transporter (DMT)-like permease
MPVGVLLALACYSLYSIGDSITKSFTGGTLSVFEILFFINLFAFVAVPFARTPEDSLANLLTVRRPLLMNARALLYTLATVCFVYAVVSIPFAETYSLTFLAPLFITLLSAVMLKERVAAARWILVALTFIGVIIVVRPGFRELGLGHLAAVACAVLAASSNTILRVISSSERQTSILAVNGLYQLAVNGVLMVFAHFVMPSLGEFIRLAAVGVLSGFALILLIRGMQRAPASHIGPTLYVQIVWAVALGAIFYGENQDWIGYSGLLLLVLAGVATIFSDGAQARIGGRWAEFRARRGEPPTNPIEGPDL